MRKVWIFSCVMLLSGCNYFQSEKISVSTSEVQSAKALMYNTKNELIGEIKLTETEEGVELTANLENLKPGKHGIHLHEFGKCEAPAFETAGAHFNPTKKQHGIENPLGPHKGDLPNIEVDQAGKVEVSFVTADFTLKKGQPTSIFDADGTSIVIHEKKDDYKTDPSGNSGARIACGVIE